MHDPEDWGAARNVDHLESALNEERRKFQQETLRTSELSAMLRLWLQRAHDQGCRADAKTKRCATCDLMEVTQELLDKPINAPGVDASPDLGTQAALAVLNLLVRSYVPADSDDMREALASLEVLGFRTAGVRVDAPTPDDGVWEALQRLIENAETLGPASREDALVVARWRSRFMAPREPAAGVRVDGGQKNG